MLFLYHLLFQTDLISLGFQAELFHALLESPCMLHVLSISAFLMYSF